jgi:hypothetical protein
VARFGDEPKRDRRGVHVYISLTALGRQAKRKTMGGRESLGNLSGLLVHTYPHILAGEVDVSRHCLSVAAIGP